MPLAAHGSDGATSALIVRSSGGKRQCRAFIAAGSLPHFIVRSRCSVMIRRYADRSPLRYLQRPRRRRYRRMGLVMPGALVLVAITKRAYRRDAIVEAASAGAATIAFVKTSPAIQSVLAHPSWTTHCRYRPAVIGTLADNGFPSDRAPTDGLAVAFLWNALACALDRRQRLRAPNRCGTHRPHNCIGRPAFVAGYASGLPAMSSRLQQRAL